MKKQLHLINQNVKEKSLTEKYEAQKPQYINTPSMTFRKNLKHRVVLIPKNVAQEELVMQLEDETKRMVFSVGPAGVGKSYLMTLKAIDMFKKGMVERIIITRPAVTADEDIGFLPGGLVEKMAPWTRPILDIFAEFYSPSDIKMMLEEGVLEICPVAFIRGRSLKHAAIIVDEAQNLTMNQCKAVLTRIAEGSRMFITGDVTQTDLKNEKSGLLDIMERLENKGIQSIAITKFSKEHVERDPVVSDILSLYGEE